MAQEYKATGWTSGELFLDWIPEDYGAKEWEHGKPLRANPELPEILENGII